MKIKYLLPFILVLTSCKKELEDKVVPQSSTSSSISSSEFSKELSWMTNLIDEERERNPIKALSYAAKLIEDSRLLQDRRGEGIGFYQRGYIQDQHLNEYGKAYQDYYEAYKIFQELNLSNSVSDCYLGMGGVLYKLGEYKQALGYYQKLLQNSERINNKAYQAIAYRAMAICYRELNENVDHIILFFEKALQIREELHDEIGIADCYNGIANTYYYLVNDYIKAKEYYLKALEIHKKTDDFKLAITYIATGLVYKELQQEKEALNYFGKAFQLAQKINYPEVIIQSRQEMGMIYLNNKDYIGAIAELKEAEEVAKKSNTLILLEEINQLLSLCYKETGDINKALSYSEQTLQIRSMNAKNELIAVINQKEQLNEVNRFEASFKQSSSLSIKWEWILLTSLLFLGIVSFIIWGVRSRRERELLTIIEENEERIDDLKYTLMDAAKHMLYQSDELNKLKDIHNNLIDQLNKRNGDDTWMTDHINPN